MTHPPTPLSHHPASPPPNAAAAKLLRFRTEHELTLEAAAELVGGSRQNWYDWEGRGRIPGRDYMPRLLALVAGLAANDFYAAAPDPDPAIDVAA